MQMSAPIFLVLLTKSLISMKHLTDQSMHKFGQSYTPRGISSSLRNVNLDTYIGLKTRLNHKISRSRRPSFFVGMKIVSQVWTTVGYPVFERVYDSPLFREETVIK